MSSLPVNSTTASDPDQVTFVTTCFLIASHRSILRASLLQDVDDLVGATIEYYYGIYNSTMGLVYLACSDAPADHSMLKCILEKSFGIKKNDIDFKSHINDTWNSKYFSEGSVSRGGWDINSWTDMLTDHYRSGQSDMQQAMAALVNHKELRNRLTYNCIVQCEASPIQKRISLRLKTIAGAANQSQRTLEKYLKIRVSEHANLSRVSEVHRRASVTVDCIGSRLFEVSNFDLFNDAKEQFANIQKRLTLYDKEQENDRYVNYVFEQASKSLQ